MTREPSLQKADFGTIYDRPDPRAYYATLAPLDYGIPQHGCDVAARLLEVLEEQHGRADPTVLDVCCSYGVLAMLLKTDLDLGKLTEHYTSPDHAALSVDELRAVDRDLLETHRHPRAPRVVGLDVAANAVGYAVSTGALEEGAVENLERDAPSAALARSLRDVDLVTTTGGVGYVTEATYDALADLVPDSTWFATFCLRTYDFRPVADAFARHGLRTETAPRTVRQRSFTDADEQRWAVAAARSLGFDTTGKEEDGSFHAELHVSRPAADADALPLGELLPAFGG
jgi:hypothetical protein